MLGKSLRGILEGGTHGTALFPPGAPVDPSSVFVRCTHLRRTQQSAQNMLLGMGLAERLSKPDCIDVFVRPPERETLYPNSRNTGNRQSELIAAIMERHTWPGYDVLRQKTVQVGG
ncbi:unnamed protein product, partial [Discosporangium mesarthrocarpum]